ncbi:MAG: M56 family metallopeptidase [Bacteroidales bacterium]
MNLLDYFIQSQVILLVLYFIYTGFLHKKISYGLSRGYLLMLLPVALLLPLLRITIVADSYQYITSYLPTILVKSQSAVSILESGESWQMMRLYSIGYKLITIAYGTGCFCCFLLFFYRILKAFRLFKNTRNSILDGKKILITPDNHGAFSVFGKIVVGERTMLAAGISQIVRHEELHCSLYHFADIMIICIQRILLWFNPLMLHIERLLREVHEYQVDERIIRSGANPKEYVGLLIDFEMTGGGPVLANRFSYLSLKNRMIMISSVGKMKSNKRILIALPILLLFVYLFCITPMSCVNNDSAPADSVAPIGTALPINTKAAATVEELPFAACQIKPKFKGGDQNEFTRWVFAQIHYPDKAKSTGTQGRVTLQFTVDEKGKVVNPKVLRGVSKELDEEALRVVSASPNWEPGWDEGKPIKVRFIFPVIFQLK